MPPPEPDADDPLKMLTPPLSPTEEMPVANERSPDTPAVPALLVEIDTLPELVSVPTPDAIAISPPSDVEPSPPSRLTEPPATLPSPEERVKLPPSLDDDEPARSDAAPPFAADE